MKIIFQIKVELAIKWETHEPKCEVHKMATPLGIFKGSSLNLGWSKCGIWLVNQWMPIFWLYIESFDACSDIVFIWDIGMLIMMIDLSWLKTRDSYLFRTSLFYLFEDVDMLIASIARFVLLSIVILILPCLFWSHHMLYRFTIVYNLIWHVDSLARILTRSSLSMIFVSLFI